MILNLTKFNISNRTSIISLAYSPLKIYPKLKATDKSVLRLRPIYNYNVAFVIMFK